MEKITCLSLLGFILCHCLSVILWFDKRNRSEIIIFLQKRKDYIGSGKNKKLKKVPHPSIRAKMGLTRNADLGGIDKILWNLEKLQCTVNPTIQQDLILFCLQFPPTQRSQ